MGAMTENEPKSGWAESAPPETAAAESGPRETSEEAACDEMIDALLDTPPEVRRLEAEKADLTDRLVRVAAEMDNLRKRSERDVADARKYGAAKFAADMLVIGDNLRRALEAVPPEHRESDEAFKALTDGVEMTEREMDRLLERNGVTRIKALGERFDPHRHQAMFEVPDASVAPGIVVQVVQEGYQIGDRVLRAALVGVSKGGAAANENEREDDTG
jgi:molecular chaperone GrpE